MTRFSTLGLALSFCLAGGLSSFAQPAPRRPRAQPQTPSQGQSWGDLTFFQKLDGSFQLYLERLEDGRVVAEVWDMGNSKSLPNYELSEELRGRLDRAVAQAVPLPRWSERQAKLGDRGPAVLEIQRRLSLAGFPVATDGIYGPETDRGVQAYRRSVGRAGPGVDDNLLKTLAPKRAGLNGYSTVHGDALGQVLQEITLSALQGEGRAGELSGTIHKDGRTLEVESEGLRYRLHGARSGILKAAEKLPSATLKVVIFEETKTRPRAAIVQKIFVRAKESALPVGVAAGKVVRVTGFEKAPRRVVKTTKGPKRSLPVVLTVVDREGKKGQLGYPAGAESSSALGNKRSGLINGLKSGGEPQAPSE